MQKRLCCSAVLFAAILLLAPALAAQAVPPADQANAAYAAKNWEKAAAAYQALTQQQPANGQAWYRLGASLLQLGRNREAVPALERALELKFAPMFSAYNLAAAHARLREDARAFELLGKLADLGFRGVKQVEADADFAALRADPRFPHVLERMRRNATPCEFSPEHRQFDFWIGEWDVQNQAGQPVGTSRIERILDGCVIFENWFGGLGGSGKSFNIYNVPKKAWQQYWMDSSGNIILFEGGLEDGKMRVTGETYPLQGPGGLRRMTFTPLSPDRVRQHGETSADGGQTWTTEYDFIYVRKQQAAGAE